MPRTGHQQAFVAYLPANASAAIGGAAALVGARTAGTHCVGSPWDSGICACRGCADTVPGGRQPYGSTPAPPRHTRLGPRENSPRRADGGMDAASLPLEMKVYGLSDYRCSTLAQKYQQSHIVLFHVNLIHSSRSTLHRLQSSPVPESRIASPAVQQPHHRDHSSLFPRLKGQQLAESNPIG